MNTARLFAAAAILSACVGDPAAGPEGARGPTGAAGPPGTPGAVGATGPAGSSYRPVFWVRCAAALDLIRVGASGIERAADGLYETLLVYTLVIYNDGDVDVECSAAIGTEQSGTMSGYYPATTNGATTGSCIASADYPGGPSTQTAAGFWEFAIDAALPRATYVDADNPLGLNGFRYSFTETDCQANMLGNNGKWTPVTLADVF